MNKEWMAGTEGRNLKFKRENLCIGNKAGFRIVPIFRPGLSG